MVPAALILCFIFTWGVFLKQSHYLVIVIVSVSAFTVKV